MRAENLLIVAGVVWLLAGINVAAIGVASAFELPPTGYAVGSLLHLGGLVTLVAFHTMFGRITVKNAQRIRGLGSAPQNPLRFLDTKGYLVMGFMIGLGVALRGSGLVPGWIIAPFYTGLGLALAFAGVGFIAHRIQGAGWRFHPQKA